VQWSELRMAGREEAWRVRVIVARIDPRVVRFRLDTAYQDRGAKPAWAVERARPSALVAVNAGQFPRSLPWGWVVLDGHEYLRPGVGPLSVGVAFDSSGAVRWIPGDSLDNPAVRRGAVAAFQSYPTLLSAGSVPSPLRAEDRGVDLAHRDARAAIGQLADGTILIAITRFDGAGGVLDFLPFGLTTPEMAAVMGALGAREAVMLDGGISSQLLIRDRGARHLWKGLRSVPLGLVAVAR
jgi:exopolysaccharide biosynthesis protein